MRNENRLDLVFRRAKSSLEKIKLLKLLKLCKIEILEVVFSNISISKSLRVR